MNVQPFWTNLATSLMISTLLEIFNSLFAYLLITWDKQWEHKLFMACCHADFLQAVRSLRSIKAIFHRSRFARAGEKSLKNQSRGHAKKVKIKQTENAQIIHRARFAHVSITTAMENVFFHLTSIGINSYNIRGDYNISCNLICRRDSQVIVTA